MKSKGKEKKRKKQERKGVRLTTRKQYSTQLSNAFSFGESVTVEL